VSPAAQAAMLADRSRVTRLKKNALPQSAIAALTEIREHSAPWMARKIVHGTAAGAS